MLPTPTFCSPGPTVATTTAGSHLHCYSSDLNGNRLNTSHHLLERPSSGKTIFWKEGPVDAASHSFVVDPSIASEAV